jgi:hypothetical protein
MGGAQLDWYPTVDLFIYGLEKSGSIPTKSFETKPKMSL